MPARRRWEGRLPPRFAALLVAAALSVLVVGSSSLGVGCGGEDVETCRPYVLQSDVECRTTQDCVDEGFTTLSCVNGTCLRPCASDADCALESVAECVAEIGLAPPAVCEDQLCRIACPDRPCPEGEACAGGRCAVAFESFEIRPMETVASFQRFGWNAIPTGADRLRNPALRLVEVGIPPCSLGDDDCAGPAAQGERYALLGTQPTSEKGSPTLEPTCRACACCLECQVEPYPSGTGLDACPLSPFVPAPLSCPTDVPPTCAAICAACAGCPDAAPGRGSDPSLVSCEATAAARSCPSCQACDDAACQACREGSCQAACATDVDDPDCVACEEAQCPGCADCRACVVCGEAVDCELVDPGAAECRRKRRACDALGADGCYPTPIRYDRSQLTPLEQSLVSPPVDLAGVTGPLVLSFAYVPFSVGRTYFESQQGVPASEWERRSQEVVVELCGADCASPGSWILGELARGGAARFPPDDRRSNGLSVGKQSAVDWRSGRLEVRVPESVRTPSFRYRFLPRLAPEARVGIDDIRIRRRP